MSLDLSFLQHSRVDVKKSIRIWTMQQLSLHKKMNFSIKDFFSKCDQICSFLQIWSHLLKNPLMENFIFCAVYRSGKLCLLHQHNTTFKRSATNKESSITSGTVTLVRSLLGQLNRWARISRPDISFDVCNLSTKIKNMKVCDIIEWNKVVKHIKSEKNQIVFPHLELKSI